MAILFELLTILLDSGLAIAGMPGCQAWSVCICPFFLATEQESRYLWCLSPFVCACTVYKSSGLWWHLFFFILTITIIIRIVIIRLQKRIIWMASLFVPQHIYSPHYPLWPLGPAALHEAEWLSDISNYRHILTSFISSLSSLLNAENYIWKCDRRNTSWGPKFITLHNGRELELLNNQSFHCMAMAILGEDQ